MEKALLRLNLVASRQKRLRVLCLGAHSDDIEIDCGATLVKLAAMPSSDPAWTIFRDRLILEYKIPKWDGDLGRPNFYVPTS